MDFQNTVEFSNISADTALSVLDTCIKLRGTTDFIATMKVVIRNIRDLCDAEHCCVLAMNEHERSCRVLCEALSENTKLLSMEAYVNDEFYDIADSWAQTLAGSSCLIAKDAQDMELIRQRNPVWYESLTGAGAHNIVMFPLKSRNELMGYVWAINFDAARTTRIRETLEVTTFIVGSELGNHVLLEKLRNLSSKDLLTGVLNRNEMNNYVDELCHADERDKISVGVIFAGLNGLKGINDFEGHNVGDVILKNAANALRDVFSEKEIYRATGDEFVIFLTNLDSFALEAKIAQIRKASIKYGNVVFALGGYVEQDSRNVRMALRFAAERMYEDKRVLFDQNPELQEDVERDAQEEIRERFRERTIFQEMNYDGMTGLPSMTYFFKLAESGRRSLYEKGIASAIVFVNLSGMKYYNKKYGFAEGDQLIKELAILLRKEFGEEHCSRFGQDHFAIYTEAEDLERRLKKIIRDARLMNGGNSLPVRAGIYPDSMGLVEASLACDRAKYACNIRRDDNSSYFSYFDSRMLAQENNRQYIIDHLDQAINENWIKAFYQPIVRSTNRKVCDEEALARWIDPKKGMLSPGDFIPILEETKLIYKVDLRIVDIIIERIRSQMAEGRKVVPLSVNLSRTDFECCDIVAEIDNRCRAAGISRDLITIEITESVVGKNFDFMKEQVRRFQELGFKVWMDDFGSGYSSLDLLQEMQFDLIKFDMRFMRQFETSPKSRVILTELMRMAQSLGIETVCEGVETAEQADFLSEIGCTRMQGYYFCKPIPQEEIWKRYAEGREIGFENPDEAEYYKSLGSVNMYDLNTISDDTARNTKRYFESTPMAILEYDGENITIIRNNQSYREFFVRYIAANAQDGTEGTVKEGMGKGIFGAMDSCTEVGNRVFLNETTEDGAVAHSMIKKIAYNEVRGVSAYVIAVLDITQGNDQEVTFDHVAQALSSDYIYLYYVDTESDAFVEYTPEKNGRGISAERHGDHFFDQARKDIEVVIYEGDREAFLEIFTKENILRTIDESGVFVHSYRLMIGGVPTFVNMKVVRMNSEDRHLIIGVNNVDAQMRQQETLERLKAEHTTYSRISALMGDFIAIYTVDPQTGNYMQYSAAKDYSELNTSKAGEDFFADSIRESRQVIYEDDFDYFMSVFSKEKILKKTQNGGIYKIRYRLMIGGVPVKITLRAGMVQEKDGPQLIVGVGRSSEEE